MSRLVRGEAPAPHLNPGQSDRVRMSRNREVAPSLLSLSHMVASLTSKIPTSTALWKIISCLSAEFLINKGQFRSNRPLPPVSCPFSVRLPHMQAELHRPQHYGKSGARSSDGVLPCDPGQETGGSVPDRDTFTRSNCPLAAWNSETFKNKKLILL